MTEYLVFIGLSKIYSRYEFTIGKSYEIYVYNLSKHKYQINALEIFKDQNLNSDIILSLVDDNGKELWHPTEDLGFIPLCEYRNNKINTILEICQNM